MTEPFIEVGRVAGTHGVEGKIRVALFSGDPSGLLAVPRVRFRGGADPEAGGEAAGRDFEVLTAQPLGGCAVLFLKGVSSAAAAARLVGARVLARREELPPPAEDEYYWTDLIGCALVDPEGTPLGEITGLTPGPAHDWLAVRRSDGEALLPFVGAFIRKVDVAARLVVASPPEGW